MAGRKRTPGRPTDAAFRRAAERAGDKCGVCGRPLHDGAVTAVGYVGQRLLVAGPCCAERLDNLWGVGLYFAAARPPRWREDDRRWFKKNPTRSHRLRPAFRGETANGQPATSWIVTRQIEPGKRARIAFDPPTPPPDDEVIAHALFDVLAGAAADGRAVVPVREIIARAEVLHGGGRA